MGKSWCIRNGHYVQEFMHSCDTTGPFSRASASTVAVSSRAFRPCSTPAKDYCTLRSSSWHDSMREPQVRANSWLETGTERNEKKKTKKNSTRRTWTWDTTTCPPSTTQADASFSAFAGSRKNWSDPLNTADVNTGCGSTCCVAGADRRNTPGNHSGATCVGRSVFLFRRYSSVGRPPDLDRGNLTPPRETDKRGLPEARLARTNLPRATGTCTSGELIGSSLGSDPLRSPATPQHRASHLIHGVAGQTDTAEVAYHSGMQYLKRSLMDTRVHFTGL